jgi:hypothetical protein
MSQTKIDNQTIQNTNIIKTLQRKILIKKTNFMKKMILN